LCSHLNECNGVENEAVYVAQENLAKSSPVVSIPAEAFALFGLEEDAKWDFFDGLKPRFMKIVLKNMTQNQKKRRIKNQGKTRAPRFKVEQLLPIAKDEDVDIKMEEEDESTETSTTGVQVIIE